MFSFALLHSDVLLLFLALHIPLGNINASLIHLLINRRMYFKERERSSLYKRQQQLEQARLAHKLEEIKSRKLRGCDSENRLPAITHRLSQPRPCQKAAIDMETQRLAKRILQLKTNKSQYFQKVIGVNLSLELPKRREEKPPPHGSTSHLQESK